MSTNNDYLTLLLERAEFNNLKVKRSFAFCLKEALNENVELSNLDKLELRRNLSSLEIPKATCNRSI